MQKEEPFPLALLPSRTREHPIPAHYTELLTEEKVSVREQNGLVGYWRLLRRHRGVLLLFVSLGGLAGLLATVFQTPLYQARTSIEIQGLNGDFMNIRQVDPNSPGPNYMASDSYVQTQIKILESESLVERSLAKMKSDGRLFDEPESGWLPLLRSSMRLKVTKLSDPTTTPTGKRLSTSLTVRSVAGQTRIVEIRADSFDARTAADFVNTLAAEYIAQDREARLSSMQGTRQWLTQQMDEMRTKLEASENRLQAYARQTGLLVTSEKNDISEAKLRQLQVYLTVAQTERASKQSRFERARDSSGESLPDVLNDKTVRDGKKKLMELKRELAEITTEFGGENPRVASIQAEIASIETTLERQKQTIVERIRKDREEARRQEELLGNAYAAQAESVTRDAEKSIRYNILKREVDTNRQLYEGMLQRVKESGVASALQAINIRIIDRAKIPQKPYKPSSPQNVSLGLLAGTLLGLAFVVTREHSDQTLQYPGDVQKHLSLRELGAIPAAETESRRRFFSLLPKGSREAGALGNLSNPIELTSSMHNSTLFAEAFRSTLLSVLYSGSGWDSRRAFVVTSANPLEGKSAVATNLAIAIAGINRKVLLIDGNLRKPRIHEMFALVNKVGLRELLQQNLPVGYSEDHLIQPTRTNNLFVLPSGSNSSEPTIMLYPARLHSLVERFRGQFDTIIVDTPPMLQFPDPRVFGRAADSVILVARAGHTTREALAASWDRLSEDGTCVLGVILNDWDPRCSTNGYYGYFHGAYKKYQKHYGPS